MVSWVAIRHVDLAGVGNWSGFKVTGDHSHTELRRVLGHAYLDTPPPIIPPHPSQRQIHPPLFDISISLTFVCYLMLSHHRIVCVRFLGVEGFHPTLSKICCPLPPAPAPTPHTSQPQQLPLGPHTVTASPRYSTSNCDIHPRPSHRPTYTNPSHSCPRRANLPPHPRGLLTSHSARLNASNPAADAVAVSRTHR